MYIIYTIYMVTREVTPCANRKKITGRNTTGKKITGTNIT